VLPVPLGRPQPLTFPCPRQPRGPSLKAAPDRSGRRATGAIPLSVGVRQTASVHHVLAATVALLFAAASPAMATASADTAPDLDWEVVSRRAHDSTAFTQGLEYDSSGRLFESTGLYGASTLREVDPASGEVLRSVALPDEHFGEGLALVGDQLLQLTWRSGAANNREVESFDLVETFAYDGEGWGLCFDGERLVMSDGSDRLTFRDADTFEATAQVMVTLDGEPLDRLNELECVDGAVWANVWLSDRIVRIDPTDGHVDGVLDLSGVIEPHPAVEDRGAVLNGIAYDAAAGSFLITGKRWPELIEIRVSETR
jgi:glutamine cyclotransferase